MLMPTPSPSSFGVPLHAASVFVLLAGVERTAAPRNLVHQAAVPQPPAFVPNRAPSHCAGPSLQAGIERKAASRNLFIKLLSLSESRGLLAAEAAGARRWRGVERCASPPASPPARALLLLAAVQAPPSRPSGVPRAVWGRGTQRCRAVVTCMHVAWRVLSLAAPSPLFMLPAEKVDLGKIFGVTQRDILTLRRRARYCCFLVAAAVAGLRGRRAGGGRAWRTAGAGAPCPQCSAAHAARRVPPAFAGWCKPAADSAWLSGAAGLPHPPSRVPAAPPVTCVQRLLRGD